MIRTSENGEGVSARQICSKKDCSWDMELKDGNPNASFSYRSNIINGVLYSIVLLKLQSIYTKS